MECCDDLKTLLSKKTYAGAVGIKQTLQHPEFQFWPQFFAKIMPHVGILYGQMQSKEMISSSARTAVSLFVSKKIRNEENKSKE